MSMDYRPNPDFAAQIRGQIAEGVSRAAIALGRELVLTLSKSASPSAPGQPPGAETGSLRRSIQEDLSTVDDTLTARVGTSLPYGRSLEYGARIRPIMSKTLSIPLTREAKRYDSPRKFPRELSLIPRKGKAPLLAEVLPNSDKITPQYVLLPSVNIAARPWLRPTLKAFGSKIASYFKGGE